MRTEFKLQNGDIRRWSNDMRVNENKTLRLTVLLISISGAAAFPVRGEDVASAIDRDVNAALAVPEVGGQISSDAACAKSEGDTAGAIDCELNTELRARAVSAQ